MVGTKKFKKYLTLIMFIAFSFNVNARFQTDNLSEKNESLIKILEDSLNATYEGGHMPSENNAILLFYDYGSIKKIDKKRKIYSYVFHTQEEIIDGKKSYLSGYYEEFDCVDTSKKIYSVIYEGYDKHAKIKSFELPEREAFRSFAIPGSLTEYIQNKICR